MDTYSELSIAPDPNVWRGIQAVIPRSLAVNICDGSGAIISMTITHYTGTGSIEEW
jgi:hypothetical protein